MTDAPVSDQAAATLDSAADTATAATDRTKDTTATLAHSERGDAVKASRSATDATPTPAGSAKPVTSRSADSAKDGTDTAAPPRSADEIEAELEATRQRLAGRLDDLEEYVQPRNVAQRQLDKLKGVFVDEYGGVKPDRVLVAVGVVVAVVGLGAVLRRRRG